MDKEKALEEYKQKFFADVEKLKAEKTLKQELSEAFDVKTKSEEKAKVEKEAIIDTMLKLFSELQKATPRSEAVCFIPEEEFENIKAELDKRYNENEVKYNEQN